MYVPNDQFFALVEDTLATSESVIITVRGNSMRPFLEGDRDQVRLVRPTGVEVGDAVLVRLPGGSFVLHRIIAREEGGKLTLQGDGNLKGTEKCTESDVMAVVTTYIRPNSSIEADSSFFRLKVRLWKHLRPFRRYLLFIYRKVFLH